MPKFDMGAAWDDATLLLRSHSALVWTIAAVFLFLPTLAIGWFGPVPVEPPAGAGVDQIIASVRQNLRDTVGLQLIAGIIGAIGGVAILRLWLSRSGTSVGDALTFAATMIPTMIAIQLMSGLILAIGFLLLIVPGLYLWGRLALVAPVVADRSVRNPIKALQQSWQLTDGNGWRIVLFLFLVTLVIVIAALLLTGVMAAVFGTAEGIGRMMTGLAEAVVGTIGGLVSLAITAATYRQLASRGREDVFS